MARPRREESPRGTTGPLVPSGRWDGADLRRAVAGDPRAGRLLVHYQPVVAASDAEPLAVEALVRWQLPDGTRVPPDRFVGLAEASGLGGDLDDVVLREALRQVVRWDAAGVRVHRVAVNAGRTTVERPDLVDVVARACALAGVGPDRLVLEVLEHDRLDLGAAVLGGLQHLVDAGTTIAVDDFGSGHAGLRLLAHLPVGLLKLDRGLLPGPGRVAARGAPPAERVLAGAVALADALGAEVTAEGVETREQWQLLAGLGVHHLQGWLFAPALTPEEVVSHWRLHPRALGRAAAPAAVLADAPTGAGGLLHRGVA